MFVAWGPELAFVYNDAYIDIPRRQAPGGAGAAGYAT
jgi:hypothetical protein